MWDLPLPLWTPIPTPLLPGRIIRIKGHVPRESDRWEINFVADPCPGKMLPDVAFHFSPRMDEGLVARNSRHNDTWGREETQAQTMPFTPGCDFEVNVVVKLPHYQVAVNGRPFVTFAHRLPLNAASKLNIEGCVRIYSIIFDQEAKICQRMANQGAPQQPPCKSCPLAPGPQQEQGPPMGQQPCGSSCQRSTCPSKQMGGGGGRTCPALNADYPSVPQSPFAVEAGPQQSGGSCCNKPKSQATCPASAPPACKTQVQTPCLKEGTWQPIFNPTIPYTYPIYGGVCPGTIVHIKATPLPYARTFRFSLQCGVVPCPPPDIGLQICANFKDAVYILSCRINGAYQGEMRSTDFFLCGGSLFHMSIQVEKHGYHVTVDGCQVGMMPHRIHPLARIDSLHLEGDVTVACITFQSLVTCQ